MASTTTVLLILGLMFLLLGWFWQKEPKNEEERLVVLRSLANHKHELAQLEERLKSLEMYTIQAQAAKLEEAASLQHTARIEQITRNKQVDSVREKNARIQNIKKDEPNQKVVSDRCQRVLDLAKQGLTNSEIAANLSLSQDAIGMILKTYRRESR